MHQEMITVLDKMEEVIPESVIPPFDRRISLTIGRMYQDAGKPEEFENRLDYYLNQPGTAAEEKLEYAQIYHQILENNVKAEKIAREILDEKPNYQYVYYWLFNFYSETEEYKKGIELANQLLAINPNDMQAKVRLEHFQKMMPALDDSN
jgi:tetratricopeptide (TPR) repeat protein